MKRVLILLLFVLVVGCNNGGPDSDWECTSCHWGVGEEAVDYGTEFSVDVENGSSEVHVFDGLVRVHPRSHTNGDDIASVDLKTSQAVRIGDSIPTPVDITIAPDRFIRSFDEPKPTYSKSLKQLSPVAYYRMAIRDQGLVSNPPQYSGIILTGNGKRPSHARGAFRGGSLQVKADSSGRGGRVDSPPPLRSAHFTLAVFVYLDTSRINGTVATNIRHDDGNFTLLVDDTDVMKAVIRNAEGELVTVSGNSSIQTKTWKYIVITVDGNMLRLYENGQLVASTQSGTMANSESHPLWLGTNGDAEKLWDGRIDELALFDKALSPNDIAHLFEAAKEKKGWGE